MTRSRWVATGLLGLAFALGGLAGGAATMLADRKTHPPRDPFSAQSYAQRLADEVGLSPEQQQAVVAVIEQHQPVMDSIWSTVREQFDAERQLMRHDIRKLLAPQQLEKYNAMVARLDSLRRNHGKRHGTR